MLIALMLMALMLMTGALVGPALAQQASPAPGPAPAPAPGPPPPPTTESVIALGNDIPGRMTVPVSIGGAGETGSGEAGPYPFTIDTGAERSVISNELVTLLKLAKGKSVRVTTITGAAGVATAVIPSLTVGMVSAARIEAPIFRGYDLGAPGLLGLDLLAGHAVRIDFEAGQMQLLPAAKRPADFGDSPDEIVIRARSQFRQLVVTEAYFRGRRIRVILDTGTAISLGNLAMRDLLGTNREAAGNITLTSVTGAQLEAEYAVVKELTVGGVVFQTLPVAFRDAAPFAAFGLRNRPALLLGMDALRQFRRVDIDFANREVRLSLPRRPR